MMEKIKNAIGHEIEIAKANYQICMANQGQTAAWDYIGGRHNFINGMIAGAELSGAISSAEARELESWVDSMIYE